MPLPTLRGKLINLRRVRRSDAESIQRHAHNANVARYMAILPHPYTLEHALSWINTTHRMVRAGTGYHLGIEDKASRQIIGMIGLSRVNRQDKNAEVGYWLGRDFWRKGYSTEAMRLMLNFAFTELDLARVYAMVHEKNAASMRLLEKCGFVREGVWRKATLRDGRFHDVFAFGLLRDEYSG
jgi:RimJ/RimL family protein N-acetyltransferase